MHVVQDAPLTRRAWHWLYTEYAAWRCFWRDIKKLRGEEARKQLLRPMSVTAGRRWAAFRRQRYYHCYLPTILGACDTRQPATQRRSGSKSMHVRLSASISVEWFDWYRVLRRHNPTKCLPRSQLRYQFGCTFTGNRGRQWLPRIHRWDMIGCTMHKAENVSLQTQKSVVFHDSSAQMRCILQVHPHHVEHWSV